MIDVFSLFFHLQTSMSVNVIHFHATLMLSVKMCLAFSNVIVKETIVVMVVGVALVRVNWKGLLVWTQHHVVGLHVDAAEEVSGIIIILCVLMRILKQESNE